MFFWDQSIQIVCLLILKTEALVQECILPRCLNSHEDALYCAVILDHLYKLKVPGFNYVSLLDSIFKEVICLMKCVTDREAELLVVFVRQLSHYLSPINDRATFERDMANTDACQMIQISQNTKGASEKLKKKLIKPGEEQGVRFVDFAGWTQLENKWQARPPVILFPKL